MGFVNLGVCLHRTSGKEIEAVVFIATQPCYTTTLLAAQNTKLLIGLLEGPEVDISAGSDI